MKTLKQKLFQLIENDLDNIIQEQKEEKQGNPLFDDFDAVMAKKLRQHDEFMKKIDFKNKK